MIYLERAYDNPKRSDGPRFLVDRLWPRGVKREDLNLEGWLKEVAPSHELRRWFSHDSEKWPGAQQRYWRELAAKPESGQPLLEAARAGDIVLIYAARDTKHNNAVALKAFLERQMAS